jgi:hypothetical protein
VRLEARVAVLVDEAQQQRDVDARGVERADRPGVALLPVPDEIREQRAGPGDAALEEAEAERRKAARDAT